MLIKGVVPCLIIEHLYYWTLSFTVLLIPSCPRKSRTYIGNSEHWKAILTEVEDKNFRGETSFSLSYIGPKLENINSIEYTLSCHGHDLGYGNFHAQLPNNHTFSHTGSGNFKPGDPAMYCEMEHLAPKDSLKVSP